ncbi:MAG TPA: CapA family protein [Moraxellaceae bacterium]|nr:CapA family protein [Moraxellaceae bacterium]
MRRPGKGVPLRFVTAPPGLLRSADSASPVVAMHVQTGSPLTLFFCGDVMTGHGIDPLLHPSELLSPTLRSVTDALQYVRDASQDDLPLPRPVCFDYPWGDVLGLLRREQPDLRLVNLEATITARGTPVATRAHTRLPPQHLPILAALGVDGVVLANHHALDWGEGGLDDTLAALRQAGITGVGAGHDRVEAEQEAQWLVPGKARIRVFAFGHASSGLPADWAANEDHPGIGWLDALDDTTVARIGQRILATRNEGDIVVVSLHWGGGWGYEVSAEQRSFAHALVDEAGVDIVWGHGSHHPRPIEVYHGRLILYGIGDFQGENRNAEHGNFRPDLAAMYLPCVAPDGSLRELRLWPLRVHLFRLKRASAGDSYWLARTLSDAGTELGTTLEMQGDGSLRLAWH